MCFYALNTYIKFRVNWILFIIRFINLFFMHNFKLQKFDFYFILFEIKILLQPNSSVCLWNSVLKTLTLALLLTHKNLYLWNEHYTKSLYIWLIIYLLIFEFLFFRSMRDRRRKWFIKTYIKREKRLRQKKQGKNKTKPNQTK